MITTLLGTCDYCGADNCEVVETIVKIQRGATLDTFACLSCRDDRPELRKTNEMEIAKCT